MQRIAIAANDVISLRRLFLEARIVRREPVTAIRSIDQEQRFTVARLQAINGLMTSFGSTTPSEFPNLRTLSSTMNRPLVAEEFLQHCFSQLKRVEREGVIILVIVGSWVLA
ncbi:MAG TPA: hypothetical protein VNO32_30680 [Candidatus Acidoferrum sp.]|nr:hypothetical protein [Candidatus Acidoferrum sp.]